MDPILNTFQALVTQEDLKFSDFNETTACLRLVFLEFNCVFLTQTTPASLSLSASSNHKLVILGLNLKLCSATLPENKTVMNHMVNVSCSRVEIIFFVIIAFERCRGAKKNEK